MNIASLSSAASLANTQTDVGVAMLSKSIRSSESEGACMVKMMERSVTPNVGGNIDVKV